MGPMVAANKRFAEFEDSVIAGPRRTRSYTCLDTGITQWLRCIYCLFNNLPVGDLSATVVLAIAFQVSNVFAVFAHLATELLAIGADA
jgi:hypothetical protein